MSEDKVEWSDNPADWDFDFVYSRVLNHQQKASASQWSGLIHELHQRFAFEKILMDPGAGGGGIYVQRELRSQKQLIRGSLMEVTPIGDQVDGPKLLASAQFILHMFKRGDPGVELVWPDPADAGKSMAGDELLKDALYSSFKDAMDHAMMSWPAGENDLGEWNQKMRGGQDPGGQELEAEKWGQKNGGGASFFFLGVDPAPSDSQRSDDGALTVAVATPKGTRTGRGLSAEEYWPEERVWALRNLAAGTAQLKNITVATREDGTHLFTKRGAHVFSSVGRDDIALSMMLCRGAFLIWLRSDDWRQRTSPEDAAGFLGW